MKYKTITFIFSKPLTEAQENILIGFFQGLRDNVAKKLGKSIKGMKGPIHKHLGGPQAQTAMLRMENAKDRIDEMLLLNKSDERIYLFKIAHEEFNFLELKGLPFIDKLNFWGKLKKRTIQMKKEIIKEMGLLDSDLTIRAED